MPYDKDVAKLRRKAENIFCRIKRYRRVNTRYDQLSITYLGFVILSAIADYATLECVQAAWKEHPLTEPAQSVLQRLFSKALVT